MHFFRTLCFEFFSYVKVFLSHVRVILGQEVPWGNKSLTDRLKIMLIYQTIFSLI